MPNPKVCNRIADPAARRRCLNYQGEFAGAEVGGGAGAPRTGAPRALAPSGRFGSPAVGRSKTARGGRRGRGRGMGY